MILVAMKMKNAKVDKILATDFPTLKIILSAMREPIIMIHCVKVRYDKNEIIFSKSVPPKLFRYCVNSESSVVLRDFAEYQLMLLVNIRCLYLCHCRSMTFAIFEVFSDSSH